MEIKINNTIRNKYTKGLIRPSDPDEIVIHGTGGGASASVLINWMLSGERAKEYTRGIALFHYLIDYTGEVFEIINPNYWVYHSSAGLHDKTTIGIEMMNHSPQNAGEFTDGQYTALFNLIDLLMKKYEIKSIVGHGYNKLKYSGSDKNCPGNFDWEKLGAHLANKDIQTEYEPRHFNIIKGA